MRSKLRSTNPLERFNREIGRRTDVVGIFPDDASLIRVVSMLAIEANDEWLVGRSYISRQSMAILYDNADRGTLSAGSEQEVGEPHRGLSRRRLHRRGDRQPLTTTSRDLTFAGSVIRVTASYTDGQLTTQKSGKGRAVPLAPQVGEVLARLSQRGEHTGDEDLVFPGLFGTHLDASALLRRYKAALKRGGLRPLRFHDLRHTFGTTMIGRADILRVKEWMGHADVETTMKYLHYAPRADDAALVGRAFALPPIRA